MRIKKYILIANSILGLLIAFTPFVLFPVCSALKPDGSHMGCFYSGIFITVMGVIVLLFSLLALKAKFSSLFTLLSACAGLMCRLVPNRIITLEGDGWLCGLCSMENHSCRADTMPAIYALISVLIVLSVIYLVVNFVQPDK